MTPSIHIREYTPGDKPAVLDLLRLNTPAYFAPEEEADLIRYLDKEIDIYYVLECENAVVGCGGINFADNRTTGKISWDIFHPAYQGKSLGTLLLKHRIKKLKTIESIQLILVRTSQLAYRFYEKNGFELLEVVKDHWAKGFDLYRMKYRG